MAIEVQLWELAHPQVRILLQPTFVPWLNMIALGEKPCALWLWRIAVLKIPLVFVLRFVKVLIIGLKVDILMFGVRHTILINYETDYLGILDFQE